ncbi:MAG: hypothetical protein WCK75_05610 [Elusimicrobiota bacterium]
MKTYRIGNKEIYIDVSQDAEVAITNAIREAVQSGHANMDVKFEDNVWYGSIAEKDSQYSAHILHQGKFNNEDDAKKFCEAKFNKIYKGVDWKGC